MWMPFPIIPTKLPKKKEKIVKEIIVKEGAIKRIKPIRKSIKNLGVSEAMVLAEYKGEGFIYYAMVTSDSSDFKFIFEIDGILYYSGTYSELAEKSVKYEDLVAYQDSNGDYLVGVSNFEFEKYIKVIVEPTGSSFLLKEFKIKGVLNEQ